MAIQFPSNPTNNQTFTANGLQYTFNSTYGVWRSASTSSAGGGVTTYTNIADLPLTGNTTGEQAFVSENNRLYIWTGTGWYNIALVNTSPTAITGANGNYAFATDGTPIVLTLVSTDPEGLPITWSYSVTSGSLENGGGTTATISQSANVFTITPTTTEDYAGEFGLTFTASDGVNLAAATSSFTLQFAILNSKYTTLMLKTTATNAQQNNTFIDSSTNNFTITRSGNVAQGTFSPYGDKWSNYFDGSSTTQLNLGSLQNSWTQTGDWTMEFWIMPSSLANGWIFRQASTAGTIQIWTYASNNIRLSVYSGPNIDSTALNVGSWHHVAVVNNGTTDVITLYVNGVAQGSASSAGMGNYTTHYLGGTQDGVNSPIGYISDFRIVNSIIYTGNFTPPTDPLTAIAGTSLLTCQSNQFKDNSANNFAITKSGDVKVQRFSPYDIGSYDSSVIGGSAYFDGTGDYLQTPSSAEFNVTGITSYTVETWFYATSLPGSSKVVVSSYNSSSGGSFIAFINPSNNIQVSTGNDTSTIAGTKIITTGQWYHLAFVRDGNTSIKVYLNGVLEASSTSFNWSGQTQPCFIGTYSTGLALFTGYISNARITKGAVAYTGNFTPPTAPLTAVANTSLLINSTNAGIYDASGNNDIETVGNAQVSTAVTKYGSSSMYFDGSGDYLSTPTNQNLVFGTGDFTVEFWIYLLANTSGYTKYFGTGNGGGCFTIETQGATNVLTITDYAASVFLTSSTALTLNTWTHVTASRNGTSLKLFINGVQTGSATNSTNFVGSVAYVGGNGQSYINAYISDLRITKGLARYTANFTPPTSELLG